MLVLSRRLNEKLIFPSINTTVQVVAIKGGVVRLGIDAPPTVSVLREELLSDPSGAHLPVGAAREATPAILDHQMRNRLSAARVGLALAQQQCRAGLAHESEATLQRVNEEMQLLQQRLERPEPPYRSPRKALLVEDDLNERELLAGLLRFAGLSVDTAGDGCDALDYLRDQGLPDIVLLDMALPRCDGAATVRQIRQDPAWRGLKIFAISGYPPSQFNLDPGGVDRWFRKPLNPELLLGDLRRELGEAP
jgi:carbon storage regulator CsrA